MFDGSDQPSSPKSNDEKMEEEKRGVTVYCLGEMEVGYCILFASSSIFNPYLSLHNWTCIFVRNF